jgi:hypothetical protein
MNTHNISPEVTFGEGQGKDSHYNINGNGDTNENLQNPEITFDGISADAGENDKELKEFFKSDELQMVLKLSADLRELKKSDITFANPILKQSEFPVFFPRTINVIQGQTGTHKSRLAEIICSSLLRLPECNNDLLEFNQVGESSYKVIYVDTERNHKEQLPHSLQKIQCMAGYKKEEEPSNFDFISLVTIPRKERFDVLVQYLNYVRYTSPKEPLFVVLDVSTDCIEDFNRSDKSMELIDEMNMAINEYDVIFLCIIHENPGTNKARGHFGTELLNKSTVAIQVSFEKNGSNEETDVVKIKYLKCRTTAKHPPFLVRYDDEIESLVLLDDSEVNDIKNNRKIKAKDEHLIEFIEQKLGDGSKLQRETLIDLINKEFSVKDRTTETRLKEAIESKREIFDFGGKSCNLAKEKMGTNVLYFLKPINNTSNDS